MQIKLPRLRTVNPRRGLGAALALVLGGLSVVGCPHRSPVWSPDSKRLLLLAGSPGEALDRPAGALWLVEVESRKARRLEDPPAPGAQAAAGRTGAGRTAYLAAVWLDPDCFVAFTALLEGEEVKEGSEAVWRRGVEEKTWTRLGGPAPSWERTPRRLPVVLERSGPRVLVYPTGSETVVAVEVGSGKELLRLEPAELVGAGPSGGFLVTRPEAETGGLELAAFGGDLKPLWARRFSALAREIAERVGKKPGEIVINDSSTSARLDPQGSQVGVNLVYTDVSWREGVSGYYLRLDGKEGKLLETRGATALPGRPGEAAGTAWAITPADKAGSAVSIRSFPVGRGGEERAAEIPGVGKAAVRGYSLSPDGKAFSAVVGRDRLSLLLYTLEGTSLAAKPVEIEIGS